MGRFVERNPREQGLHPFGAGAREHRRTDILRPGNHRYHQGFLPRAGEGDREAIGGAAVGVARLGAPPDIQSDDETSRDLWNGFRQRPKKGAHGLFIDGGVSPYNNPGMALLMLVTLQQFGICWDLGANNLSIISVGTGWFRTKLSFNELGFAGPLKLAVQAMLSAIGDAQNLALIQLQWLGKRRNRGKSIPKSKGSKAIRPRAGSGFVSNDMTSASNSKNFAISACTTKKPMRSVFSKWTVWALSRSCTTSDTRRQRTGFARTSVRQTRRRVSFHIVKGTTASTLPYST